MLTRAEYSNIIKQEWSLSFYDELRPELGIAQLVSNTYEGQITGWGDRVNVPTMLTPGRATIRTNDNEAYNVQNPTISNQTLIVDRSSLYAVDVTDWARYVSNPNAQSEIQKIIAHEVARSIDDYTLSLFSSATSQSGVTALGKSHFAQAQRVLNLANVPMMGRKVVIDSYYLEDILSVNEIISRDYNATTSAFITGRIKDPVYGFEVYVSNLLPQNTAWFFHESFLQVAVQKGAEYKEIDLESATNVPSMRVRAETLFGAKLFDSARCFKVYNT
jgi:hypothetical protein